MIDFALISHTRKRHTRVPNESKTNHRCITCLRFLPSLNVNYWIEEITQQKRVVDICLDSPGLHVIVFTRVRKCVPNVYNKQQIVILSNNSDRSDSDRTESNLRLLGLNFRRRNVWMTSENQCLGWFGCHMTKYGHCFRPRKHKLRRGVGE